MDPIFILEIFGLCILNVLTIILYGADKIAAKRDMWRIPEINLHFVGVLGGWPGAIIAQQMFRHKTQKQPFRKYFFYTIAVNIVLMALIHVGIFLYYDNNH